MILVKRRDGQALNLELAERLRDLKVEDENRIVCLFPGRKYYTIYDLSIEELTVHCGSRYGGVIIIEKEWIQANATNELDR